jgi:hypothetical protein
MSMRKATTTTATTMTVMIKLWRTMSLMFNTSWVNAGRGRLQAQTGKNLLEFGITMITNTAMIATATISTATG